MKLIFFGSGQFAAPSLRALLETGFKVAAVVTQPDKPAGRGRQTLPGPIKQIAVEAAVPVLQPVSKTDIRPLLEPFDHVAGVVVSYGKILPADVLDFFDRLINVHASLLPKFRGPSPIEAAILSGQKQTGISIMDVAPKMDTGGVYVQEKIELGDHATKPQLYEHLSKLGAQLLAHNLEAIFANKISAQPQDETAATYCKLIQKADAQLNWELPAVQLERQVRAHLGWPGSHTVIGTASITILESEVDSQDYRPGQAFINKQAQLAVGTGQGSLVIKRLQPASRKAMTGADFLAGYSHLLGV